MWPDGCKRQALRVPLPPGPLPVDDPLRERLLTKLRLPAPLKLRERPGPRLVPNPVTHEVVRAGIDEHGRRDQAAQ